MNIKEFAALFPKKMEQLKAFAGGDDVKDILGTEAVKHYEESFQNEGFTDEVQKALVSDLVDKNKKGTGLGMYNALLGITLLPASLIAGLLYDKINSSIPFYFGAITAVLSALLMVVFVVTKPKNR
ncbi:MAG: MFS transporter [Petrimonas sp.]|jgi:Na+/H+ antiporter NhaC